jgi:3-oxoacyl-[acyl-carrier protein] reductase
VSGKIAVITGGEGALAQAIRSQLLGAGWIVHAPGRTELDVRRAADVTDWFARLGAVDLLINNAGIVRDAPLLRMTEADWDEVIDTNLKGAFLCSRAATALMQARGGGHILQIGSFSALRPPAGQAAYAASKAGLIGLTQALAAEWGAANIRVNCVLPGFLETRMTAGLSGEVIKAARSSHTLQRFNTVEAVARLVVELAAQPNLSGQIIQGDSRIRRW